MKSLREGKQKELLIIIPAYNEEKNIATLLDKLEAKEIADIADVLIMNDASTDSTNWQLKGRKVEVITHVFNLGYGSALQLGYKYAKRHKYNYVIQMDADGQHDVKNIHTIYERLKQEDEKGRCPDIVLGSRFVEGASKYKAPFAKKIAWSWFRGLINLVTGRKIKDPTTGLQGLSRKAFSFYSKYNNFDDKYPDANMILLMLIRRYRIVEVPAIMHERTDGVSMHSGIKPFIYMFRMTFSILAIVISEIVIKRKSGARDED